MYESTGDAVGKLLTIGKKCAALLSFALCKILKD